jgi:hypothetical protein
MYLKKNKPVIILDVCADGNNNVFSKESTEDSLAFMLLQDEYRYKGCIELCEGWHNFPKYFYFRKKRFVNLYSIF